MVVFLALTYIFIKICAPKLPTIHEEQGFMKGLVIMAISWIGAILAFKAFGKYTKIEEFFISQCIANTFCNVGVPTYFISTTPNLFKYVKSFIFTNSNQIEAQVHYNNTTQALEIQHL